MTRTMLRLATAALALLLPLASLAQDFSKVEIKTTKLADNVYMLVGAGGNIGLGVGDDAVFVIDDQFAPLTPKISAAIASITPKPVKFILNTHWHGDHTGGNENFAKTGTLIVAHENVRKRMSTEQFIEALGQPTPPSPAAALPVVTFDNAVTFHLNGEEIRAIHVPNAHTDGDAVVHFLKSDVIHMGDVEWNRLYPFIDTDSGGSVEGTIAACDKMLAIATDKTKIIPGHGPLSTKQELKAYRDMLVAVSARVRALVAQGKKIEDIVATNPTAEFDAQFGKGSIKGAKFVEMMAKDFVKRPR